MNTLQIWFGDAPIPYPEYRLRNASQSQVYLLKGKFPEALSDKRVILLLSKAKGYAEQSDIFRFWFLWKNPDFWYIDCDAWLKEIPETVPGKPYFAEHKNGVDNFLIFGNGNPTFFNSLLDCICDKVREGIPVSTAQHWTLNELQTNIVPKKFFIHNNGVRHVERNIGP